MVEPGIAPDTVTVEAASATLTFIQVGLLGLNTLMVTGLGLAAIKVGRWSGTVDSRLHEIERRLRALEANGNGGT